MYVTASQLADGSASLNELAELYNVEPALLAAVIAGGSTSAWAAPDVAVATEALASIGRFATQATAEVDARLVRRGYSVPMDAVQFPTLAVWARAIARYHLHRQRDRTTEETGRIERDYKDALRALDLIADGKLSLGAGDPLALAAPSTTDDTVGGKVRITSQPRKFSRTTLGEL